MQLEPRTPTGPLPPFVMKGRIPCLDGLRAFSILLVLFAHVTQTHHFPATALLTSLHRYGAVGVQIFFAISGFLITLLLFRERHRFGSVSIKQFYVRRFLRVLPAYSVFLIVLAILQHYRVVRMSAHDWIGALTYTTNYLRERAWPTGHIWSLSIEEHFYLVWPLLMVMLAGRRLRTVLITYLCMAPLIRLGVWLFFRQHLPMVTDWTVTGADSIAWGCLLATVAADRELVGRIPSFGGRAGTAICLSITLLLVSLTLGQRFSLYAILVGRTVESALITYLIWCCVSLSPGRLRRLLELRGLVLIGTLSYSIYLWQQLFLDPTSSQPFCRWPVNLVLALLAASLSYWLVEAPFLRLKERLGQSAPQKIPASTGTTPAHEMS